ncbi:MAG TPA: sulfite exporter TauE/SafE family protein [Solirubrobacterales bacterium]|nr:sulfite exporter TauE/SafE family protein [Solirubrobacterales bacterium]
MQIFLAIVLGLGIGVVVGTLGGGGAILALPVFVYVLGEGVSSASTASLIVVTLGASAGAGAQALKGRVCWRVAAAFAAPAAVGAYLGTSAGASVSPSVLILAFVPVMLVAAALTYAGRTESGGLGDAGLQDCPRPELPRSGGSGLVVGMMTGFFGVGGGFLIVPALTSLLGLSLRRAIATSLAVIGLTGLIALGVHLGRGAEPDWPLTVALSGAAVIGALAGSSLGSRVSTATLSRAFAVVVALLALALLIDVLVLGGPPSG